MEKIDRGCDSDQEYSVTIEINHLINDPRYTSRLEEVIAAKKKELYREQGRPIPLTFYEHCKKEIFGWNPEEEKEEPNKKVEPEKKAKKKRIKIKDNNVE